MFYNFRKNKKAFTLVELIVVIAIIAILGAVVGVTVATFVNRARRTAATTAFEDLAGLWDVAEDGDTLSFFIKGNFKAEDLVYVKIDDAKYLTMKKKELKTSSFKLYFHDDNCGDYYGVLTFKNGVFEKTDKRYAVAKDDAASASAYNSAKAIS